MVRHWPCSLLLVLAAAASAHAQAVPSGFTVEAYGDSFPGGTAMAWSPDGRLFVCQQGGAVRVLKNGTLLPTPFHTAMVDNPVGGERGLLGICFGPGGSVYIYFTNPSPAPHNCVRRLTASAANPDVSDGTETVIVDLEDLGASSSHNGGGMAFGSDGTLFVAVGDNTDAGKAQSLTSRFGKILRYNADGSIPGDNPMAFQGVSGTPSGEFLAIWAIGLRNPFRIAFQPGTMHLHINDVGEDTWEEVNEGAPGLNYGWVGGATDGVRNLPDFTDPILVYAHTFGNPMGTCITGGAFYNPSTVMFPASYVGQYFFADFGTGFIAAHDQATPGVAIPFLTGASGPVDLAVGPDGALYYLSITGTSGVYRVSYGTAAPVSVSGAAPAPAAPTAAKHKGGCGATGLEGFLLTGLLALWRRRA